MLSQTGEGNGNVVYVRSCIAHGVTKRGRERAAGEAKKHKIGIKETMNECACFVSTAQTTTSTSQALHNWRANGAVQKFTRTAGFHMQGGQHAKGQFVEQLLQLM